jgi:hypothetical protein
MVESVYTALDAARASGDPASLGDAQMAVVESLVAVYDSDVDRTVRLVALESMQEHLDGAFEAFKSLDDPLRNAYAWLTQAAASAEFAFLSEDAEARDRYFYQAIDCSERSLKELYRFETAGFDLVSTACTQVLGVLARLRALELPQDHRNAVDAMIGGVSELMGEALADDFRFRNEGMERIHTARWMGLLADMTEDPEERLDTLRVQFDLVVDGAETLRDTSAVEEADKSMKWAQAISAQIERAQGHLGRASEAVVCPDCGRDNETGSKYCIYCGALLTTKMVGAS